MVFAKTSHLICFCPMEQEEVSGKSDVDKIDLIQCAHVIQTYSCQYLSTCQNQGKVYGKVIPCVYFNKNTYKHMKNGFCSDKFFLLMERHICIFKWIAENQRGNPCELGHATC